MKRNWQSTAERRRHAITIVVELYRDKILSELQARAILIALAAEQETIDKLEHGYEPGLPGKVTHV